MKYNDKTDLKCINAEMWSNYGNISVIQVSRCFGGCITECKKKSQTMLCFCFEN